MKQSRRHFLLTAGLAAGSMAAPQMARAQNAPARDINMRYRTLGRTGLKVSEVGFGGYPVKDPGVIEYAREKGINYIDAANCYPRDSELAIGRAIEKRRDDYVVATKWCPHHIGKEPTKANFIAQLDDSLRNLRTDHVDILFNHQLGPSDGVTRGENFARLDNPELWEAWETVRQAGKARFFGVSGHEGNLMEVMNHAVDSGKFDVILCRYNFMNYPTQPDLIKKCAEKNVGFIAMKTLAGARGADVEGFRDKFTSFKQAALKWVLSNPDVSNLIISISDRNQVDEYAVASGKPLTTADADLLREYRQRFDTLVCRMGSECEPACPYEVRVADILRAGMYYHEYREETHGLTEYASIPPAHSGANCAGCAAPCEKACPHHLPIRDLLVTAHARLQWPGDRRMLAAGA
ncbi:aldo/keto reductase [Oscillatoria amoena NRMC-F 0135]|nr:aldo/keto reductase [Oscillatoria amoena NRMC-F 0135]